MATLSATLKGRNIVEAPADGNDDAGDASSTPVSPTSKAGKPDRKLSFFRRLSQYDVIDES